jgi:serine phosphatase RsbU (regulator of sigma subunit)
LPWDWQEESIGFTIFVACLGVIAGRRFLATEHDLASLQSELATAQQIQRTILPLRLPEVTGLHLAARFRPTSAVAGDFYDFMQPAPFQLGLVVADASGHGVPAALIASMVKVAFKSQRDRASQPSRLLSEVNGALYGCFRHGFVTAAYAYVDAGSGDLLVASAGHPLPLLRSARHSTVRAVGGQGPILGRFVDAEFLEQRLLFELGDRLVIYTDGFTEARNGSGEPYGEDRLREFVSANGEMSAEEFCDSLLGEIDTWSRERSDDLDEDDLTLVVVDRT